MKQGYIFTLMSLALFSSCGGGTHIIPNTPPEPNPTPVPEETDYYVSPACSDCRMEVKTEPGRGLDRILGFGYDITGDYLSTSSLRAKVIDTSMLPEDALSIFPANALTTARYTGANATGFLSNLMANVNDNPNTATDKYFTGTLNSPSSNSSYVLEIMLSRKWIGGFPPLMSTIRQAISDEFKRDVQYMRASALVDKYGTHFISHACTGIAVKTLYSTFVDATASQKVSYAYKGMQAAEASLKGNLGPDLALTLAGLNNYGATLTKTFCGGEADLVEYDPVTGILGSSTAWEQGIDYYNCTLVSLDKQDIVPLNEAIEDPVLSEEVSEAIKKHITEAQKAYDVTVPLLQNTNGKTYRYVTGYDESLRLEDEEGLKSFGVLGSLYQSQEDDTLPLFTLIREDGNQIISLLQPTDDWTCIGYVLKSRTDSSVPLYEITDGKRYAYTIEAANSYGPKYEWHPTGMVFYLLRP